MGSVAVVDVPKEEQKDIMAKGSNLALEGVWALSRLSSP